MQPGKMLAGTVLRGEYVLLGPIGEVGHEVFRANHRGDNRTVAVRIWRGNPADDVEHNFEIAEMASRIRHPLLATVEAYGQERDGSMPFVATEYVPGQRLDQWADSVGIPPLAGVMDYVHKLCLALHVVHRAGFAHRAVNPRNLVMFRGSTALGQQFNAKLLDHGIPSFMRSRPPRLRSAQFMAPEQLAAALQPGVSTDLETDSRLDVYGCGCLLYYLCTGGAPFPSRSLRELVAAHAAAEMLPPSRINPSIPEALESVIVRALSLRAQERYRDGAELASALDEVRRSSSISGVVPRVVTPSTLTPMLDSAPLATLQSEAFDERPTLESEIPLTDLHEAWSKDPTLSQDSVTQDELDTERPPPASTRVEAVSPVVPAPPKIPDLRHPFEPLAIPSAPAKGRIQSAPPPVFEPLAIPSTPAKGRIQSAPPPPHAPELPRAAPAFIAGMDTARSKVAVSTAYQRQWLHSWWLWPVAGALCVVGYLQLERWDAPAKVQRTTAPSAIASTETSTETQPSSFAPTAASPQTPTPMQRASTRVANGGAPPASHTTWSQSTSAAAALVRRPAAIAPRRSVGSAASAASSQTGTQSAAIKEAQEEPSIAPLALPEPPSEPQRIERATPAAASTTPRAQTAPPIEARRPTQPLLAEARILALSVRGSLATSEVRRAVERIQPQLVQCYTRIAAGAARNAFGELGLEVVIDESGRAHNPRATGGALPGLDHCVEQAATKLVSARPPDTGIVKASWRVAFVPRAP